MDRYAEIKRRLMDIAHMDDNLCTVIAIGSSVRTYSQADEFSDIDLIIACKKPEEWLYGTKPELLGDIDISFVEPTLGGGMERRMLFDGALDVDLIVFTPQQLMDAIYSGAAAEVMNRGYIVMYDDTVMYGDNNVEKAISENVKVEVKRSEMTEQEFINMVNDFWFHTIWAAKKILRGELWTAKMCIDAYLKSHLLKVLEQSADKDTDVWHCGRFVEKWAQNEDIERLSSCFAHYDRDDMITALMNTADMFGRLARKSADMNGFAYPEKPEKAAYASLNRAGMRLNALDL